MNCWRLGVDNQRVKASSGSFTSKSPTKSSQWISEKMLLAGKRKTNPIHPSILFGFSHYYWSIIASQYCVTFCRTKKWIRDIYIYISLLGLLPTSPPPTPHPSRSSQSTWCVSCAAQQAPISYMCWSSYSSHPLLLPLPTCLFSMSASLFLPWK